MNSALLERACLADTPVAVGTGADVLDRILAPHVQLALWNRPRPPALDWIDALDWDEIDDIDAAIHGPDFRPGIARLLRDAGYPQAGQHALCVEAAALAQRFARLMGCADLRLRVDVIETDACRKFHMDYVTARLLMPLSGPGTQWIEVAARGSDLPINQLDAGHVGIFKGRLSVDEPAILHRSPPVATSGETRLLLVLDTQHSPLRDQEIVHA